MRVIDIVGGGGVRWDGGVVGMGMGGWRRRSSGWGCRRCCCCCCCGEMVMVVRGIGVILHVVISSGRRRSGGLIDKGCSPVGESGHAVATVVVNVVVVFGQITVDTVGAFMIMSGAVVMVVVDMVVVLAQIMVDIIGALMTVVVVLSQITIDTVGALMTTTSDAVHDECACPSTET